MSATWTEQALPLNAVPAPKRGDEYPCQNPHCDKRRSGWDYNYASQVVPEDQRRTVTWSGRATVPKYCSQACRQFVYRLNKAERDEQAARLAAERAAEARFRRLVGKIKTELAGTKLPVTVQQSLAERIARKVG